MASFLLEQTILHYMPIQRDKRTNGAICYDLRLKVLSNKTTLILSNIRELNRVPSTK